MASMKTKACCGHSEGRHILVVNGGRRAEGQYLCLTGFCLCGIRLSKAKAVPGVADITEALQRRRNRWRPKPKTEEGDD